MPTGGTSSGSVGGTVGGISAPAAIGMTIGGVAYDYKAGGMQFAELIPYTRDGMPTLRVVVKGGAMLPSGDPFKGKSVVLSLDAGTGNGPILRFAGDFTAGPQAHYVRGVGWCRYYVARGLRNRMDWVPMTNSNDGSDVASFNLDQSDPKYFAALAGRSTGQILQYCLDMPDNSAALASLGIGHYVTTGFGATATCTLSGTSVGSGIAVTSGGYNYASPPTVLFEGGGGYGAAGSANVSGGSVTGITLASGGAGYTSPPAIVLSGLPAVTLNDLAGLTTVYPAPVYVQGQQLGGALDASLREMAPNYAFHVDANGYIRFLDLRSLGQPLFLFTNGGGAGARAVASVVNGVITGASITAGGAGYDPSYPPSVLIVDATGSGATASCTVATAGSISAVAIGSGGSGYSSPRTLTLGVDRVNTEAFTYQEDLTDVFTRVEVRGMVRSEAVYFETAAPPGSTVSGANGGLAEMFGHDGLTNAQAKSLWKLSDWTDPTLDPGQASATVMVSSGAVTGVANLYGGYGYTSPPAIHLTVPPGSTASGASLTASISGGTVVSVHVASGGSGYATPPTALFDAAGGASSDVGTCTIAGTTSVTVKSSFANKVWGVDYWDQSPTGRMGQVILTDPLTAGVNARTRANILSCTALTPGGTCTLQIDNPLPLTSYTSYVIQGLAGGASNVWRLYQVTDAASAAAMQTIANYPVPWISANGNIATQTMTPVCSILYSPSGAPPYQEVPVDITIDPVAGTILLKYPAVQAFGSDAANSIGGSSTTGLPASVRAMLIIAKGKQQATYPPDATAGGVATPQYGGTGHSEAGLAKTLVVTAPWWKLPGNQALMSAYAADLFDSCSDVRKECQCPYFGIYEPALSFGLAINVAGLGYATGLESLALPVLEAVLSFDLSHSGAKYVTEMHASNRRAPHAAALFQRAAPPAWHLGIDDGAFSSDPSLDASRANSGVDFDDAPRTFGVEDL